MRIINMRIAAEKDEEQKNILENNKKMMQSLGVA